MILCAHGLVHVVIRDGRLETACWSSLGMRAIRISLDVQDKAPTCLWCAARGYP